LWRDTDERKDVQRWIIPAFVSGRNTSGPPNHQDARYFSGKQRCLQQIKTVSQIDVSNCGFDQNRSFSEPTVRNYLRLGHKSDGLDEGFQTDIQIQAMLEAIQ